MSAQIQVVHRVPVLDVDGDARLTFVVHYEGERPLEARFVLEPPDAPAYVDEPTALLLPGEAHQVEVVLDDPAAADGIGLRVLDDDALDEDAQDEADGDLDEPVIVGSVPSPRGSSTRRYVGALMGAVLGSGSALGAGLASSAEPEIAAVLAVGGGLVGLLGGLLGGRSSAVATEVADALLDRAGR